jgi:RHS repeat-associated protein
VLRDGFVYATGILGPVAQLDSLNAVIARFVYGTSPAVPDYMVTAGATYKVVTDHLGSVRLVVDVATGSLAQRLDYDALGNVISDSRPGFQPFGFAGGLYDHQTGLTRFGARDYDPVTGRFTAPDPILFDGGQTNLYAYALNNPVSNTDPTGLCNNYNECTVVVTTNATLVGTATHVVLRNIQGFARTYTAIIDITKTAMYDLAILAEEAQVLYPRLANMAAQWHHIIPKYLGGAANGLMVRIPAAYHQLITNAFRAEYAYGQALPTAERLMQIVINVYSRYPIPLLPWR